MSGKRKEDNDSSNSNSNSNNLKLGLALGAAGLVTAGLFAWLSSGEEEEEPRKPTDYQYHQSYGPERTARVAQTHGPVTVQTHHQSSAITPESRDSRHHYSQSRTEAEQGFMVDISTTCLTVPFPGANGKWVGREEFPFNKSFGRFRCRKGHFWQSAHAYHNYHQKCKKCNNETLPQYMWLNNGDRREDGKKSGGKPHDESRCGKCRELGEPCWK